MQRFFFLTILLISAGSSLFAQQQRVLGAAPRQEKVSLLPHIAISAKDLLNEYMASEKEANAKYLNKALQVSGKISGYKRNEDGGITIALETGNPDAAIICTMKSLEARININQEVTIKGFCAGSNMAGISLTDCVIAK